MTPTYTMPEHQTPRTNLLFAQGDQIGSSQNSMGAISMVPKNKEVMAKAYASMPVHRIVADAA